MNKFTDKIKNLYNRFTSKHFPKPKKVIKKVFKKKASWMQAPRIWRQSLEHKKMMLAKAQAKRDRKAQDVKYNAAMARERYYNWHNLACNKQTIASEL